MNLETKLREWFNEIKTDSSFDVHCQKLEDLLNESDAETENMCQEVNPNRDLVKDSRTNKFIKVANKLPYQPNNSVLNLCDIFQLCSKGESYSFYGELKVATSCEIENERFCKIINLLIKTKFYDVNDKLWNSRGLSTPLSLACVIDEEYPNIKCIDMLLANGADTKIKMGMAGNTILHHFLMVTKADDETCIEVIKLFMKYGYDINTVSSSGYTLLHTCARYCPYLIKPLVELGIDITLKNVYGRDAFNVYHEYSIGELNKKVLKNCKLVDLGFDINERDNNGCNLLMLLVYFGAKQDELIPILQEGCEINAVDKCGRTALHYVFIRCRENKVSLHNIKVLLKFGADWSIKDKFGKTAFQYITYKSEKQQVKCLCYIFNRYKQLFTELDLKLDSDEVTFLSGYHKVTKPLTLIIRDFDSTESFFTKALYSLTEENIKDLLYTKGVGTIENSPEFQSIQSQVHLVMERLASQLSENTPFKIRIQCSGSVSETCKVGLPNEFDYLFIIEEMENYFDINPSETPGFALVQKSNVENYPDELSFIFTECGNIVSFCFLHYLGQKIFEVLQKNNIWEGTELYRWTSDYDNSVQSKPVANFLLEGRCHVPNFKDIDFSIDVVPALCIPNDKMKNFFVNDQEIDSPKLFLLPTKSDSNSDSLHKCRISTSLIETDIISSLPRYLKNAFMLLKILNQLAKNDKYRHWPINTDAPTTYHLKTVLLHTSSRIMETNKQTLLQNSDDDIKLTIEAAHVMIQQYAQFNEDNNLPSYIFKNNLFLVPSVIWSSVERAQYYL